MSRSGIDVEALPFIVYRYALKHANPELPPSSYRSIRINDQWRVCIRWTTDGAQDAKIIDYH